MSAKPRDEEVSTDDCLSSYTYVFAPDLLQDQVAFITGGGSGIGFRIAEIFMRHGCDTAIASRRLEKVEESAKKLELATGRKCLPLKADVRKPGEIESAVDRILQQYGKINILVNNAAGNFLCPTENLSYNAFETVMEIDAFGTYNVSKAVHTKWFSKNGGNIINISSTLQYKGSALQLHAGSAKAAIDAMTRHMAVEWGINGIRVNCIAPGPIAGTEGLKRLGGGREEAISKSIPLQRMGEKYEIADTAVFLASKASAYTTGAIHIVDGGSWLSSENNFANVMQLMKES